MIVRELITKLGFKADQRALDRFNRGFGNLRRTAFYVTAAVGAASTAVLALTKSVANYGDNLAKTSARVGLSVRSLQKFEFAANLAGADLEVMNKAVVRFARVISDANEGLETAERGFRRVGIDPKKVTDMESALYEVSDAFAKMPDGIEKTTAAQELFGRSGAQLINLLNQGSAALKAQGIEAEKLGFLFDQRIAKQTEKFNDTIFRLRWILKGIKNLIGIQLIPVITDYMEKLKDWLALEENRKRVEEAVRKGVELMTEGIRSLVRGVIWVGEKFDWMQEKVGGIGNMLKILGIALGALLAGKIINSLILMASGFKVLGTVVSAVVAGIGAVPAAIIAAVVAAVAWIYLLYDDIKAFFEGRDSITEMILRAGVRIGIKLREVFEEVKEIIKAAFDDPIGFVKAGFSQLGAWIWDFFKDTFNVVAEYVSMVFNTPLDTLKERFYGVFRDIAAFITNSFRNITIPGLETLKGLYKKFREHPQVQRIVSEEVEAARAGRESKIRTQPIEEGIIKAGMGNLAGQTPMLPAMTPAPVTNEYIIDSRVEVNVESGADPEQIAREIEERQTKRLGAELRRTLRASEAGGY